MRKVHILIAFLINYLIILAFVLILKLTLYIKTGIFELTEKDFIYSMIPPVILISLHVFIQKIFL